jgi:CDP-glucose 4,6-dehydratase
MDGFFSGKRVFLTGHTGFKGAWLSLWLHRLGARVRGFALEPPSRPSLFDLSAAGDLVEDVRGDLRDAAAVAGAMSAFQPDIVVHMAAQALVRPSYNDPAGTFASNALGTAHVLDAVRRTPSVQAVVNVTSDKCYENREWVWGYRENDPFGGHDPYSASKACAEIVAQSFARSFFSAPGGPALASARAGNVIGGGDFGADRLIPDLARAAKAGTPALIRNPKAVRPWQHVLEPLSAYLLLARRLYEEGQTVAGGWNFGPEAAESREVGEMAGAFCRALGHGASWTQDPGGHPHEARLLRLDCSKARALLGWRPRLDVDAALEWTAAWYRAWLDGSVDLRGLAESQIADYEALG